MKQLELDFLQGLSASEIVLHYTWGAIARKTSEGIEVTLMIRVEHGGRVYGTGPTLEIAAQNALRLREKREKIEGGTA